MERANGSHAPPVSVFPKAPLSFKRNRGMSSPDCPGKSEGNGHHSRERDPGGMLAFPSRRGQTKSMIAAKHSPLHFYVLRPLSTTADRRKASLIHRFTTERLWLSFSTRPMRT
ncbi:hypothetical protein HAX54_013938 [Datura stramonium]|uniref:Uncharacterized protein n=1 Tax=Datura stramonium TaxID=4076 RepID=A0ABS8TP08_DATST|nr:hypothetical protein [Datura stramonium]